MRNRRPGQVGLQVSKRSPGPRAACRGPWAGMAAVEKRVSGQRIGRYRTGVPANSRGAMPGVAIGVEGLVDGCRNAAVCTPPAH